MVVLRDLRSMFWGVTVDGGKRYTQTVERSFHISMAALEAVPEGNSLSKHLPQVSVMINHDKAEFLLCTLNHKHLLQQTLDLNFTEGEEVTFFLNGQGVVHLTGYLLEDQMDESPEDYTLGTDEEEESMEEMSDEYEESDEAPELVNVKKKKKSSKQLELTPGLKRKAIDNDTPKKKLKLEELDEDESDEEDDSEDDDWGQDEFADFIDDEAEEEESDEEEDEEDMVESKTPEGKNQSAKAQKKKKKDKQDNKDDEEQSKETKATPQNSLVAGGDANASSKKKKKKKKKKNKEQEAGSNQQTAAGQQQSPKPQQQTPKPQQQTPKPQQQQQKTPKKQVLAGGVLMEELKVGNGPDAKKGKMVHVYYVGRLNNGKEFDSCKSGKPFRFRLGKFEVIKGWEIGIEGMKVGGKRRLTVPPQQGYGSQKQGEIPPNSTLIFDVELKAVS